MARINEYPSHHDQRRQFASAIHNRYWKLKMNSPMSNADLVTKIKDALSERFGIDITNVDQNSRLRDLGVDSLHVVEIMLDMETDLGIKLQDLSVPPNPSLGEVAAAIERNLAASA